MGAVPPAKGGIHMTSILDRGPKSEPAAKTPTTLPASTPTGDASVGRRPLALLQTLAAYRAVAALPGMALLLAVAIVVATATGTVPISPWTTTQILLNQTQLFHFAHHWPVADEIILRLYREPRVMGAALVGMALGVAGTLFQGLLRNPLADPLLLGTSAGASLGATLAFALTSSVTASWLGFGAVAGLAFVGALLAVALVYALATRGGRTPIITLLLAGVAVGAVLTAAQTLIITLDASLQQRLASLYFWVSGAINVQNWAQLGVVGALVAVSLLASLALAPTLDALALGEEMATHVGLRVERRKLLIVAVAALLVAAAVSISGLVGFVGLVAPHACRIVLGPRNRLLVPASALVGAIFVVAADLLARTLAAPTELPLGVLTALIGAPFFLALLRRAGQAYRW